MCFPSLDIHDANIALIVTSVTAKGGDCEGIHGQLRPYAASLESLQGKIDKPTSRPQEPKTASTLAAGNDEPSRNGEVCTRCHIAM
jgi:hypothetical protein